METRVTYRALAWSFFRVGASAFGGGWASLPVFEAELAGRRGWFGEGELAELFALAQAVPGVILVNFAVLAGGRLKGKAGAVLAGGMAALPAFLLILVVAAAWEIVPAGNAWVRRALLGLQAGVVALIASASVRLGKGRGGWWLLGAAAVGVAMWLVRIPFWLWLVGGAAVGVAWEAVRGKMQGGGK